MQIKDHILLGKYLLDNFELNISPIKRHAFLLGCFEPDVNVLTYTRGSVEYQILHGHNADNCKKHLTKVINKLQNKGINTLFQWFSLGTAIHYIADTFTFPHNDLFSGDIYEHNKYEKLFHKVFKDYISNLNYNDYSITTLNSNFENYHKKYLDDKRSYLTDCKYIANAAVITFKAVANDIQRSDNQKASIATEIL